MSSRLLTESLFNKTVGLIDLFHGISQLTIAFHFSIKKTTQNCSERHFWLTNIRSKTVLFGLDNMYR